MTDTEFEMYAIDRGHEEFRAATFEPARSPELHTHAWSTLVYVTGGVLRMGYADREVVLGPGEWCEVAADELHSERTGVEGASALLAVRRDAD